METHKPIHNNRISTLSSIYHINWRAWLPSRGNVVLTLMTLVVVVALFWAQSAHALPWTNLSAAVTSTTVWPYQGRLNNSAGTPLTAAVPMTFKLYNVSSGGTALWQEQWMSVQVTGGLFNVMLGSLIPIPQSVVSNNNLWLGITVGSDSEMTPRVQLGSVPFSGQALTVPDGSIGTAQMSDGAVTSDKVADASLQSRDVHLTSGKLQSSADLTLTANSQDIPGTQFTLNPDTPQTFLIITTADVEITSAAGYVFLFIDGVQQPNYIAAYSSDTGRRGTLAQTYLVALNPGTHTIVLKAHKEGSGGGGNIWKQGTAITYMSISQ